MPSWLVWTLTALCAALALHGAWVALAQEARAGPEAERRRRAALTRLGLGLAGIALLLPHLFDVRLP